MTQLKLKQKKAALQASERPPRAREAAKQLGISEVEYVALSCGDSTIQLDNQLFVTLLIRLEHLGEVMALSRNDAVVFEHHGVYKKPVLRHPNVIFNQADIDLRLKMANWTYGFAVDESGRKSFQFFDQYGEAVHKVYMTGETNMTMYEELVSEFAIQCDYDSIQVEKKTEVVLTEPDIDDEAIRKDWKALDNAHHVDALMRAYSCTRPQAYRHLGEDAIRLNEGAFEEMLEVSAEKRIPLLMFVPNNGTTQIHNGCVKTLKTMGPWFNVLDPKFNMHANMSLVKEIWMVTKHIGVQGKTCSMELFDENQQSIMMIYLNVMTQIDTDLKIQWHDLLMSLEKGTAE